MTVTRFAPSPTGYIHVGNLRTALMNYLIARQGNGTFVLRLDDTDPTRSTAAFADAIKEDLRWLGLHWDRVETQSSRLYRYDGESDHLRASGRLYECFETPTELDLKRKKQLNMGLPPVYDRAALNLSGAEKDRLRTTRSGHWRFKLDQTRIEWTDGILGDISIDAASVSDPVLIRGDGQYLYTLASVVDDIDFGITHVVRGSDHVTNTATQIQIIAALGGTLPTFSHHSLLTGPQGESLSKRLGTLALRDLRAQGIEPMAMLSHLARLGSSHPVELCHTMDELVKDFDLGTFGSAPTKFDVADLGALTAKYVGTLAVKEMSETLIAAGVPEDIKESFWMAVRGNVTTRDDVALWWQMCAKGAEPLIEDEDRAFVAEAMKILPKKPLDETSWKSWTAAVKDATGRTGRALFMPLRKALTGRADGPDMNAFLPLLQVIKARG